MVRVAVEADTDEKKLFYVISKDVHTTERRLKIDIFDPKESYARGEIEKMGWIPGRENTAEDLTKDTMITKFPLWELIATHRMNLQPLGLGLCRTTITCDPFPVCFVLIFLASICLAYYLCLSCGILVWPIN